MGKYWQPTAASYFRHVPIVRMLSDIGEFAPDSVSELTGLSKIALAAKTEAFVIDTGGLPKSFRATIMPESTLLVVSARGLHPLSEGVFFIHCACLKQGKLLFFTLPIASGHRCTVDTKSDPTISRTHTSQSRRRAISFLFIGAVVSVLVYLFFSIRLKP